MSKTFPKNCYIVKNQTRSQMPILAGQNRHQIQMLSLDQQIESDNSVRVLDAFVNKVDLKKLGFLNKGNKATGRPAYDIQMLLKLYLYGYLNRVRSSRQPELACKRNIELWWLLEYQQPGYKTIANFRKDNRKALTEVFRTFNKILDDCGLFGKTLFAVDGSKFRAQNSKKNNFSPAKVKRQTDYIDQKLEELFEQMDRLDARENRDEAFHQDYSQVLEKVEKHLENRANYEALGQKMEEEELTQISTTDPEARAMPLHMGIVEIAYNVQSVVDDQHNLIVHFEATNEKDDNALSQTSQKAMEEMQIEEVEVLADKGYHTGSELKDCAKSGITTLVAPKANANSKKDKAFQKNAFTYNGDKDTYTCPEGKELTTNGNWYQKNSSGKNRRSYKIKRYTLPYRTCSECPFKEKCVGEGPLKNRHGRAIERSEYADYIEANAERVAANKEKYRRRQQIVEHPFGTIKRAWGYTYTLLKGLEKVNGEFALIFTAYNIKRAVSLLGVNTLLEAIQRWFLGLWVLCYAMKFLRPVAFLKVHSVSRHQIGR